MKKIFILFLILITNSLVFSQNPPNWNEPEWWPGSFSVMSIHTMGNGIIMKDSNRNINYPLKIGDWIGVFCVDLDGSLKCVGMNQYINEKQNLGLNLVADNPITTDYKEGFYENEKIKIKFFRRDIYEEINCDLINFNFCDSSYYDCDGYFNNGSLYSIDTLMGNISLDEHIIFLKKDWSFISSYLKPMDKDIENMFESIVDNVTILKTMYGQVYWPDEEINSLKNWWFDMGYEIKMKESDTLKIYGKKIDFIELNYPQGWHLIPVPYNYDFNVENVFVNLENQQTGVVKDLTKIYWPFENIKTLYELKPGNAYKTHFDTITLLKFDTLFQNDFYLNIDNNNNNNNNNIKYLINDNSINIKNDKYVSYILYDILGKEIIKGESYSNIKIFIKENNNFYILVLNYKNKKITKKIFI